MKKLISLAICAMAGLATIACKSSKENENAPEKKALVIYYSQTGTTKAVAEEIARLTGADMEAIEVTEPYDGDFGATIARCQKEKAEGTLPKLKPMAADLSDYDVIYLGYPIWFGTYAPPIAALIDSLALEGKTVVPFCTFGSGGLEVSINDLRAKLPGNEVTNGYGVRTARIEAMPAEVERFLKESKLIEGEVEPLPAFSDEEPVGEPERQLFDMACGDYQFPLGTPLTYATRPIAGGTEYKFGVDNKTTIYVTKTQEGDMVKVEFTKVVR